MNKIYEDAMLREKLNQSKYLNKIKNFDGAKDTQDIIESDLLDIIVFCKWCIERLRNI
jgi:hypothetical protein